MDCIVLRWWVRHISVHLMMTVCVLRRSVVGWWPRRQWLDARTLLLTVGL
jgi:hypothetical protein